MIEVCKLSVHMKEKIILQDVSFTAESAKITGLVGDNGSGKTVIMKCICGFIMSYTGSIKVNKKEISDRDRMNMGILIETPSFIPYLTGFRNLESLAKINKKIKREEIERTMCEVGLNPKNKIPVGKYSLGMRQRLGIAQALMENPDILILDEPFNGLDAKMIQILRDRLLLEKKRGKTIVISSHNKEDIDILCDKRYRVGEGKIADC